MEHVILVNESDEYIGTIEKMQAHRDALLHRAFSVFIFNSRGDMLLQKRARNKYHSAGLWTNTCCSHPKPDEDTMDAATRRLKEEMGFTCALQKLFSFTYKTSFDNGLAEFEFDHVFGGVYESDIQLNEKEVEDYAYKSVASVESAIQQTPWKYTAWFIIAFPKIKEWLAANPNHYKKH